MSGSTPADRRARATVRRFASAEDADRHDLEYWRAIPQEERVLEVWRLSEEQWRLAVAMSQDFSICCEPSSPRTSGDDFIRNKRQTGRLKDLADVDGLD